MDIIKHHPCIRISQRKQNVHQLSLSEHVTWSNRFHAASLQRSPQRCLLWPTGKLTNPWLEVNSTNVHVVRFIWTIIPHSRYPRLETVCNVHGRAGQLGRNQIWFNSTKFWLNWQCYVTRFFINGCAVWNVFTFNINLVINKTISLCLVTFLVLNCDTLMLFNSCTAGLLQWPTISTVVWQWHALQHIWNWHLLATSDQSHLT